ncbi:hypothetical protein QNM99_28390 [Pseudomonas sp. PCH446]
MQALAFPQDKTAPGRQHLAIHPRAEIGTGQGQTTILLSQQRQPTEGHFDHRGIRRIAQQMVGPEHRYPIQRPPWVTPR